VGVAGGFAPTLTLCDRHPCLSAVCQEHFRRFHSLPLKGGGLGHGVDAVMIRQRQRPRSARLERDSLHIKAGQRAGSERWAMAPNAGGAGQAEVGMLAHLRIWSPARTSRSTGSVRPRRQSHPRSPFSQVGPRTVCALRVCPDTLGRITKFSKHEPN